MKILLVLTSLLILSDICFSSFDKPQDWLDAHNSFRRQRNIPDLKWDDRVAASAKAWADYLADRCTFLNHERNSGYGENLASQTGYGGKLLPPLSPVTNWMSEEKYFDPNNHKNWCKKGYEGRCLHFTQVMWRKSKYLGCATSKCVNGGQVKYFRVCRYDPMGNFIGQPAF